MSKMRTRKIRNTMTNEFIEYVERALIKKKGTYKEMESRKDAAYEERNQYVALIARMIIEMGGFACKTKTAIEGWSEDWQSCVYITLPTGQVSCHYHDSHAWMFDDLPYIDEKWDGHDTIEKYHRVNTAYVYDGEK
jgi:hypothetical protein